MSYLMTRSRRAALRAVCLSALLLAAGLAPGLVPEASAQARAPGARSVPMSKVVGRASAAKAAGCIVPAPLIVISPNSITFPTPVGAGACAGPQPFTVANTGTKPVFISYVAIGGGEYSGPIQFSESCSDGTLGPGETCSGTVDFCPDIYDAAGLESQMLVVYHDAGSNAIPVSGTVAPPAPSPTLLVSPSYLDFETVSFGLTDVRSVTLQNTGGAVLNFSTALGVGGISGYAIVGGTCGSSLAPGADCTVDISFTAPAIQDYYYDSLVITHNGAGSPTSVSMSAYAGQQPGLTLTLPPPAPGTTAGLYFYGVLPGTARIAPATFTNLTGGPITPTSAALALGNQYLAIASDGCSGVSVPSGGTCQVNIGFNQSFSAPTNTSPGYNDTLNLVIGGTTYPIPVFGEILPPYPNVNAYPSSFIDYGTLNIGQTSDCGHVEFRNDGSDPAYVSIQEPGFYATYFPSALCTSPGPVCAAGAPFTLAPGASCWRSYYFSPSDTGALGPIYESVGVNDGNGWWGTVTSATLYGVGRQPGPVLSVVPSGVSFGAHVVGTPAPNQAVTITNDGDGPLTNSFVSPPSYGVGFSVVSTTCGTSLPAGMSCQIVFGLTPAYQGSLYDYAYLIGDNGSAMIYLDGEGVGTPTPSADFYPMNLDFGNVTVNATSASQTVSFANTGSGPMTISGVVATSGEFAVSHDCPLAPATLAAGACCTITSTFSPTAAGPVSGAGIEVTNDSSGSPHVIPLSGNGVPPPSITASPASIAFPDQVIGTASAPVQVVITNSGITVINVTSLGIATGAADFSLGPLGPPMVAQANPPAPKAGMAPGLKAMVVPAGRKATAPPCALGPWGTGYACFVEVSFKPSALGVRNGALSLAFSGGTGSPATVPLAGNGTPAEFPIISVSSDAVAFGDVVMGTTASRSVSVSNIGTGPLAVTGVRTFGPFFSATTSCSTSQAPGSSCEVVVSCKPDALGARDGDLYVDHSAEGGFKYVKLTCAGVPLPLPRIEVSATGLSFGNQSLGKTSASHSVVVRNVGAAPLAITGIGTASPFDVSGGCPASLEAGASCTARVSFTPSRPGLNRGILGIGSNDPNRPLVRVDLSGTGCRPFSIQAARRGINLCGP